MESFRQVLHDCNFIEVPLSGPKFTWSRGKGSRLILEKLDRGLANESLFSLFPMLHEEHILAVFSDHAVLFFNFTNQQKQVRKQK